jgi:hypothetical protein
MMTMAGSGTSRRRPVCPQNCKTCPCLPKKAVRTGGDVAGNTCYFKTSDDSNRPRHGIHMSPQEIGNGARGRYLRDMSTWCEICTVYADRHLSSSHNNPRCRWMDALSIFLTMNTVPRMFAATVYICIHPFARTRRESHARLAKASLMYYYGLRTCFVGRKVL